METGVLVGFASADDSGAGTLAAHDRHVSLHRDPGTGTYILEDSRTSEVCEMIDPPLNEHWDMFFDGGVNGHGLAYFESTSETHWVTYCCRRLAHCIRFLTV
jgi:hypothetical protein